MFAPPARAGLAQATPLKRCFPEVCSMQLHMSRSSALASVVLGGLVIGACAGTSSGRRDECFEIINGEVDINVLGNSATVSGFCIKRLNSHCPELVDCKAEWYIDTNNNGTRDAGEPHDLDMAANPGNEFCQGTVNVNQASQYAGATLRWQVEAFEQDSNGNKRPIKSTGGAYKLPG